MGIFFDETDNMQTVKDHIGGKHTPDSVREDAEGEYRKRRKAEGASDHEIKKEIYELRSF
jgi:hypothetical protein